MELVRCAQWGSLWGQSEKGLGKEEHGVRIWIEIARPLVDVSSRRIMRMVAHEQVGRNANAMLCIVPLLLCSA